MSDKIREAQAMHLLNEISEAPNEVAIYACLDRIDVFLGKKEGVLEWPVAAIAQQSAPAAPEGWKLVPVEPTAAIMNAADAALMSPGYGMARGSGPVQLYRAMLAAAPAAPIQAVPADLRARCAEIIGWQKSGVLVGDALRGYARAQWYANENNSLQMAESDTARQAYALLASAPAASAPAAQEPVAWEYRAFHDENTTTPGWGEWERIEAANRYVGETVQTRAAEIQSYIDRGYRYELRALYTAPSTATEQPTRAMQVLATIGRMARNEACRSGAPAAGQLCTWDAIADMADAALADAPAATEQPECGCCGQTGPCDPDCDCAEQPDTVKVPCELLERAMYAKDGSELIAANRELRALLETSNDQ